MTPRRSRPEGSQPIDDLSTAEAATRRGAEDMMLLELRHLTRRLAAGHHDAENVERAILANDEKSARKRVAINKQAQLQMAQAEAIARAGIDALEARELTAVPKPHRAVRSSKCPFDNGIGFTTMQGRRDWLTARTEIPQSDHPKYSSDTEPSLDPTTPLYFWQMYSLLGPVNIEAMVCGFYTRVHKDTSPGTLEPVFRKARNMEGHISHSTAFWIDNMGGGEKYHGGDEFLNFQHEYNAITILNATGAQRWLRHMGENMCSFDWRTIDARIKPCLIDFLRIKMKKYASAIDSKVYNKWAFDESDFSFVVQDAEMSALWAANDRHMISPDDVDQFETAETPLEDLAFLDVLHLRMFARGKGKDVSHVGGGPQQRHELLEVAKQCF
jgi:truncated hemoglobin YjbI